MDIGQRDDGTQNGPGEQIRLQDERANENLDNQRGGVDPSGGQSREVPRDNSKAGPATDGRPDEERGASPPGASGGGRPTEDDLARQDESAPSRGGDQ